MKSAELKSQFCTYYYVLIKNVETRSLKWVKTYTVKNDY